jgi:hypothetical protein
MAPTNADAKLITFFYFRLSKIFLGGSKEGEEVFFNEWIRSERKHLSDNSIHCQRPSCGMAAAKKHTRTGRRDKFLSSGKRDQIERTYAFINTANFYPFLLNLNCL